MGLTEYLEEQFLHNGLPSQVIGFVPRTQEWGLGLNT